MFRNFLFKAVTGALVFAMTLMLPAVSAWAEEAESSQESAAQVHEEREESSLYTSTCGNYLYEINDDGTITLVTYKGEAESSIVIPAQIDGYSVSTIGNGYSCVFYYVGCSEVTISEGITTIKATAFYETGMQYVSIPASVTNIEEAAFDNAMYYRVFKVDAANPAYKVENNALLSMDGKLLLAYSNSINGMDYTIPDGVTRIAAMAFAGRKLGNVVISDSVIEIGDRAFLDAKIENLTIGSGVKLIDRDAFNNNEFTNLTIPGNVETLGSRAFYSVPLENVTIENGVKTLEYGCLGNTNLTSIVIPASIEKIYGGFHDEAFQLKEIKVDAANAVYKDIDGVVYTLDEKMLVAYPAGKEDTTYTIPQSVEVIEEQAFSWAKNLKNVYFPNGLKQIGFCSFEYCTGLLEVKLPHTVEFINGSAFTDCSALEAIVLPGKLTAIYVAAFSGCGSLKSIFITSEITTIHNYAFSSCKKLTDVYYVGNEEDWSQITFGESNERILQGATIHYLGNLRDFVDRMYNVALDRAYDATGLNNWVQLLVEESHDGAGLAKEFILGPEFALRNLSDEQYVDVLYTTFFNREADAAGKELWLGVLASGQTREYVLSQFVNLNEFTLLCAEYGIHRGVMFMDGNVAAPGLPQFVGRLYDEVLSRSADGDGLYNWTAALATKAVTAEEAAVSFFMSQEYAMKNVDSSTFVTDCYSVFMDREADAEGLAFWVSCLEEAGVSREWVIAEFAASEEFKTIASKYGL